jgi:hypothetical protein
LTQGGKQKKNEVIEQRICKMNQEMTTGKYNHLLKEEKTE